MSLPLPWLYLLFPEPALIPTFYRLAGPPASLGQKQFLTRGYSAVTKLPFKQPQRYWWASQVVPMVKNSPANAGDVRDVDSISGTGNIRDVSLIPGLGRSSGSGHGNPLQYSFLENPTDRGAWWTTVHSVAKNWTRLKQLSTHARNATCASPSRPSLYESQEATNSISARNPRCLTSLPLNFLLRIPVPLHFHPTWFCNVSPPVDSCYHILNSLRRQAALNFILLNI